MLQAGGYVLSQPCKRGAEVGTQPCKQGSHDCTPAMCQAQDETLLLSGLILAGGL